MPEPTTPRRAPALVLSERIGPDAALEVMMEYAEAERRYARAQRVRAAQARIERAGRLTRSW